MRLSKYTVMRPYYRMAEDGEGGGDGDGAGEGDGDTGAGGTNSLLGGDGGDGDGDGAGGGGDTTGAWPDDWRNRVAGEDEKRLNQLNRYASPEAALDSFIKMQNSVRSGELVSNKPFPVDGDEKDQAAWRAERGLPEKADGYDLGLDDGVVVGDDDKPIIDGFLEQALNAHMSEAQVQQTIAWYFEDKERQLEAIEQRDQEAKRATEDILRDEWGTDYRRNINIAKGLLDGAPDGVKDRFLNSRGPDGTPLGTDADTLRWLVDVQRQLNPASTVVPGVSGTNVASTIEDEIATIEKLMRTNRKEYNADDKLQQRHRELIDAQLKLKAKAG